MSKSEIYLFSKFYAGFMCFIGAIILMCSVAFQELNLSKLELIVIVVYVVIVVLTGILVMLEALQGD